MKNFNNFVNGVKELIWVCLMCITCTFDVYLMLENFNIALLVSFILCAISGLINIVLHCNKHSTKS